MEKSATKLAINLSEGTIQVEGDESFVRFIYQDFKEHLSQKVVVRPAPLPALEQNATPLITDQSRSPRKRGARKTTTKTAGDSSGVDYKPKFDAKLDLTGLEQLFDEWKPENNNENILLFAVFLRDQLKIEPCTADHAYTCFVTLNRKGKTKVPSAFLQSFRNAQIRTNYIEYISPQEIRVTIPGDNRFNEKKHKKKDAS